LDHRLADKDGRRMTETELASFLDKANVMRIAYIDERDGHPMVHPVWYYHEAGKFFVAVRREGRKARSIRKNRSIYFLIDSDPADSPPLGVRGKATATVVDDQKYATDVTRRNILRYLGSLEGKSAQRLLKIGSESCVLEITPVYMATWKF
jgi:hypothetical protein